MPKAVRIVTAGVTAAVMQTTFRAATVPAAAAVMQTVQTKKDLH